jgi:superfamily II DNA or RNA helicase
MTGDIKGGAPVEAPEGARDAEAWQEILRQAFAERAPQSLQLAEQALRAFPGDPSLLYFAALAALLDGRPDRCLTYLKRMGKRFITDEREELLRALALGQQGRFVLAAEILKRRGLDDPRAAAACFLGDWSLLPWLGESLEAIHTGSRPQPSARAAPARKAPRKGAPKAGRAAIAGRSQKPSAAPQAGPVAPPPDQTVADTALPRLAADIPVSFELIAPPAIGFTGPTDDDPAWFRLRAELAHLSLLQGFDELLCLAHLHNVDTYWYQVETVRKVLKQFRGRVLLADEVGLGKTIEAGMVLKEYLLRGMAERVLILTPAALVGQWREEMESKFDIVCASTHDSALRSDPGRFWAQPRIIASIAVARRQEHASRIVGQAYDVVIVDEAHHLKNQTSQNHKLVDALRKRFLLLLSATPVQNSLVELYNLLTLLKPGIFRTQKEFRAAYMTPGNPRTPANRERLRDLMRDVMIRNTRALVALRLPQRHAATLRVEAGEMEAECYHALGSLAREIGRGEGAGRQRLTVHHLLSAAGSSPAAAASAIDRLAARHSQDHRWRKLAERYRAVGAGSKAMALLDLLERNKAEKKIVFVHHRETLAQIDALLTARGLPFVRFDGALSGQDKDAAIATFRDRVPILLSTQSGGEGRNIQFCNTLINFDIPWNPMAIEQRIGRIDRIGQQREVFIFNLVARGTVEDHVLRLLDEKINMFELVVGEIGAILGEIEEQRDFSELILGAWLEATEGEQAAAFDALGEQLVAARRDYEAAKVLDDALFGEEFEAG